MLKQSFDLLQERLLDETLRFYGSRLVSLVVYGSVGRGTQTQGSDLDFLIIAEGLPDGRMSRVAEFATVEGALEADLRQMTLEGITASLSPIFKSPEEARGGSPLFLDMIEDGRVLYDRNGYFQAILDRLKIRLEALGAQRKWSGSAWYWDLKPGCKAGEVFEL